MKGIRLRVELSVFFCAGEDRCVDAIDPSIVVVCRGWPVLSYHDVLGVPAIDPMDEAVLFPAGLRLRRDPGADDVEIFDDAGIVDVLSVRMSPLGSLARARMLEVELPR